MLMVTAAMASWATLALSGLGQVAGGQPALTDDTIARLVEKGLPALDPAGKKQALRVTRKHSISDEKEVYWILQLEWTEEGRPRKGVAVAGRVPDPAPKDVPFVAQVEGWGLVALPGVEDRDLDSVAADMQQRRLQANEAVQIGDLRAFISAEMTYESVNFGSFDTPACLLQPTGCLPKYPPHSPVFLYEDPVRDKNGYRRKFHAGPKVPSPGQHASPSSMTDFAMTAVPLRVGETGNRGFCADASGIICFTADGSEPRVTQGQCPISKGCEPIR